MRTGFVVVSMLVVGSVLAARDVAAQGCEHSVCVEGEPLMPECGPIAEFVCMLDPYCCHTEWDFLCVERAEDDWPFAPASCFHPWYPQCPNECVMGAPLEWECSECVREVCTGDPWCCTETWNEVCIEKASHCGVTCW